ncbi:MAG: 4Fe-4S dicluster domain-containing protein [Candidatus Aminicenantes bacterium]|jgi:formate hydrogenlyase subunit 6|nr:4Fe-4S dicluster domain-containing protein [Candidatus Aminicenantes bacterium]
MRLAVFLPELLRSLFKKPNTVDYPFKKLDVPKDFRGTPFLHPEICIACRACERDCPAEAIEITSVVEAEKKFKMIIHNDRCIHCAQCVDSCPTNPVKAMEIDHLFETADFDRHNLKMEWEFVRALPKKEPKPAAAPPKPEPPKTEPAQ